MALWVQHAHIFSALQLANILVSSNYFGCFPTQTYIIKESPKNVNLSIYEDLFFSPPCLSLISSCSLGQKKKFQKGNATFPQTTWQEFFLQQPPLITCTSFTSHQKLQGQKSCSASRNCQGRERKARLSCHFQQLSTQQQNV